MLAHLFKNDAGQWFFSGHNACGDPYEGSGDRRRKEIKPRPFDAVVDVGADFLLTPDADLYIIGPSRHQFSTWSPAAVIAAARQQWFGFSIAK